MKKFRTLSAIFAAMVLAGSIGAVSASEENSNVEDISIKTAEEKAFIESFENQNLIHTLLILTFLLFFFVTGEIGNADIILVFLKDVPKYIAGDFAVKIKLLNEFQCTENIVFFICLNHIHFRTPPQRCDFGNRTFEGFFQIE